MQFCCKFHLTGGDQSAPCEDRDDGHVVIGVPMGPEDDDEDADDETESPDN